MRFKLTFVLLLANLVIFFLLWRLNQPPEIVARPAGPIPKDNFSIDHIIIKDDVQNEVRELKLDHNNVWHLTKPVDWLASDFAVQDLITHLQFLDEEASFSVDDLKKSGQTLKDFGLDNPAAEITVQSGARTAMLYIGRHTTYGGHLYVMNPADGLVRVVAQELLSTLDMPLDELREKRLFTLNIFAVQSLSISASGTGSAPASSFTRFVLDNDKWRLDTPFSCEADGNQVNTVISHLTSLRAESFVTASDAGDLARYGLTAPSLKIGLKGDSADPSHELWLGNAVPDVTEKEYYAKLADNPTVVVVKDDESFTTLFHAQDALRERQFLDFLPEKISTISVRFLDSPEVRMQMLENHTWQIGAKDATGAPTLIAADSEIIQAMLASFRRLSAKNFASDAPTSDDLQNTFNLKTPEWKVILQGDKTLKPITLDIGIRPDPMPSSPDTKPVIHYYAKVEGADSVYEIESEILSQLSMDPLHYRDRMLEKLPAEAQIVSFKLTHLTGDDLVTGDLVLNYSLDPAKATWDDFLKDKPQLIRDNLLVVLDSIKQFEVESYRQARFDEHYQMNLAQSSSASIGPSPVPWRYRLDAGVLLTGAGGAAATTETLTFYFSDRLGGSQRLGGTREPPLPPAIFNLPMNLIGALGSITREQDQPAAAVETTREIDQPINPAAAAPAFTSGAATATPSVTAIAPVEVAVPAPTPATPAP